MIARSNVQGNVQENVPIPITSYILLLKLNLSFTMTSTDLKIDIHFIYPAETSSWNSLSAALHAETIDDTAYFQASDEDLFVPRLM